MLGWGRVFSETLSINLELFIGRHSTFFQAEAYAFLVAENALRDMSISGEKIRIFFDSQGSGLVQADT